MSRYSTNSLIFLLFILLALPVASLAQSKKDLQEKKKQLQKEIEYTNKLLSETEKSKNTSLNQLRQIDKQISSREELINTMEAEIAMVEDTIELLSASIDTLENEIEELKEEYAKMINFAYRNRDDYDRLMFILSSENFYQAFKRLKYFQQYSAYRKSQAERISAQQELIDSKINLLTAIKKSKEGLLKAKLLERNELSSEKNKKEEVVNSLKGKEQKLKKDLQQKREAAEQINKAIEKIIAEEIRRAREAAKKAGKSEKGFPMTPEAQALSNSFAENKGKLPWPVGEGVITAEFGEHPHPTLKGVKVQNNGIDISTKKGNMGRAIYKGKVSRVIIIPREGKVVMISHGDYFTVYSYFKEVFVSAGDEVDTKQSLGVLVDDQEENASQMHLEIWKVMNKLDPASWIYKSN
ncbi:MAG: peptidase M23 [Flavobacteriales bacterium]|nr:peptidase M23 [Flavobacteriales bacterium]